MQQPDRSGNGCRADGNGQVLGYRQLMGYDLEVILHEAACQLALKLMKIPVNRLCHNVSWQSDGH